LNFIFKYFRHVTFSEALYVFFFVGFSHSVKCWDNMAGRNKGSRLRKQCMLSNSSIKE
jgi:hypothetical protein